MNLLAVVTSITGAVVLLGWILLHKVIGRCLDVECRE